MTLLREGTWTRISAESPQELRPWSTLKLVSAGGTPLTIYGSARVELDLEGEKFTTEVVVVSPLTSEAILGLDFLQEQQASINLAARTLSLKGGGRVLPLRDPAYVPPPPRAHTEVPVRAMRMVEVPPRSELEIAARLDTPVEGVWLLQGAMDKSLPAAVACALVAPTSTTVLVCLLNPLTEPVTVYAGMTLATLESVEPPLGAVDAVSSGGPEVAVGVEKQELLWSIASSRDKTSVRVRKTCFTTYVLLSYADVIASSTADLGKTDRLRHSIHTGDASPVRQPVHRVPPQRRKEVRKLLSEMLERGVVEPSTSPWASPIVLVRKKDGSTRFCIDYRKLNDVTRKDAYPLPWIDATVDRLHGSQWFSTFDLLSGYWQVEVDEADRQKTAFCTPEGLFQFKVMPFGLCNAPATFQRLMDLVLAGLQWSDCLVYIDDVIVLGRTFDEHLRNLRSVLQLLRESGLRLNQCKCSFFQKEVQYLGHIISRDGVATDPSKTEKVTTWPTPKSVRVTQQFLGFAGYYRRFVKDFAQIGQSLHRLTERPTNFVLIAECQDAFDELRRCLTSAPILAYPDFSR